MLAPWEDDNPGEDKEMVTFTRRAALAAPLAITPALAPEIVTSLNAEVQAMLALPETERRFAELSGFTMRGSADRFAAFVRSEITKWAEVIRKEGLQLAAN